MGDSVTKLEVLRSFMAAGAWRQALKLAASFPRLGDHKVAIQRGWEAMARPNGYRAIGVDPDKLVAEGIAALKARYPMYGEATADLFDGVAVDFGRPTPSMRRARDLVADVEGLQAIMDETFVTAGLRIVDEARALGAHSVARAVRWLLLPDTVERHGYDAMHCRVEDVAARWLERHERHLLATRGPVAS